MTRALAMVFILGLTAFVVPSYVNAQQCPPGSRAATGSEIERAKKLGIVLDPNTKCLDQFLTKVLDANIDQDVDFFNSRICSGKKAGLPAGFNPNDTSPRNWDTIRKDDGYVYFSAPNNAMNPGALRCFRRFFEEMEKQGFKPCVNSALRSLAHQRASCLAPNAVVCGRSGRGTGGASSCPNDLNAYRNCPHVNGLAMDVGDNGGRVAQVLAKARGFNGFSKVGAGAADPWHIEARNCADPNFMPSLNPTDTWSGSPAPTSALTNSLRTLLQPAQPAVAAQPAVPAATLPTTASPAGSFSAPTAQVNTPTLVSDRVTTGVNATSSTANALEELVYGSPTTSTSTKSVPITVSGSDVGGITSKGKEELVTATAGIGGSITQSTFDSDTLVWEEGQTNVTGFQAILSSIQKRLQAILLYLKPFGRPSNEAYIYE